jgi:Multicopper oxidase
MTIDRRRLLQVGGMTALSTALPESVQAESSGDASASPQSTADQTIRIGNGLVELAPDRIISTTTYNGQFPGPLLRFKEGQQVVVDIHNDTDTPEQLHWHGQTNGGCGWRIRRGNALYSSAWHAPHKLYARAGGTAFLSSASKLLLKRRKRIR